MAFVNRIGNILKQTVSKHINLELSAPNSSLYQSIRCMSSSKLFVGGLSYGTDETSLREEFTRYGEVVDARIIMDRETGRSRGFGFISYTSSEEASSAIQAMDGQDLHGRRIRVNYATERSRGGGFGGGYGGGGSFNYGGGSGYGDSNNYTGGDGNYSGGGAGYGGGGNYGSGGGGSYGGGSSSFDGGNSGGYGGGSNIGNYSAAVGSDNHFSVGSGNDSGFAGTGYGGTTGTSYGHDEQLGGNQGRTDGENESFGQEVNYRDDKDEPDDYANTRG